MIGTCVKTMHVETMKRGITVPLKINNSKIFQLILAKC
jgi:hypothetical protein